MKAGTVKTVAGDPNGCNTVDGPASSARFGLPEALYYDNDRDMLFIAETVSETAGYLRVLKNDVVRTCSAADGQSPAQLMGSFGGKVLSLVKDHRDGSILAVNYDGHSVMRYYRGHVGRVAGVWDGTEHSLFGPTSVKVDGRADKGGSGTLRFPISILQHPHDHSFLIGEHFCVRRLELPVSKADADFYIQSKAKVDETYSLMFSTKETDKKHDNEGHHEKMIAVTQGLLEKADKDSKSASTPSTASPATSSATATTSTSAMPASTSSATTASTSSTAVTTTSTAGTSASSSSSSTPVIAPPSSTAFNV